MLVDSRDMTVKAVVGSADFFDAKIEGQVNGTQAKRSPGSTLKPFIYALGIDQGVLHPLTMVKDAQLAFGAYSPENFDGRFAGPLSAKEAQEKGCRTIEGSPITVMARCGQTDAPIHASSASSAGTSSRCTAISPSASSEYTSRANRWQSP